MHSVRLFRAIIAAGLQVQFQRWNGEDLHNRFVLTELGGVAFLEGLDQYDGKGRSKDVVVLLDRDVAQQLIENYTPGKSSFRHIDECEIVGNREP